MRRRLTWWVCCPALALLALGTEQFAESFRFTYEPVEGHRVTLVFESSGVIRLTGVPGFPDGSVGQFESMTSVTERVRESLADAAVVAVVYDSSYAQYTVGSGWVEWPAEWTSLGPYQWLRDRQFVSSPLNLPPDPFFINVARGLQWTPRIPLPASSITVGRTWPVEFQFPVTTQIPSDSALLIAVELAAAGSASLDSIVERPADTLAFVTLSVELAPTTISQAFSNPGDDLPVTLSGSVTGSYIWSTGWHTWVANESRVALEHRIEGLPDATMWLTVVARSRIRP